MNHGGQQQRVINLFSDGSLYLGVCGEVDTRSGHYSTTTELRRSNGRALAISQRCPLEKLVPPGEIFVSGAVLIFPISDSAIETAVDAEPSGSWMEVERDVMEDGREFRSVADAKVLYDNQVLLRIQWAVSIQRQGRETKMMTKSTRKSKMNTPEDMEMRIPGTEGKRKEKMAKSTKMRMTDTIYTD